MGPDLTWQAMAVTSEGVSAEKAGRRAAPTYNDKETFASITLFHVFFFFLNHSLN